VNKIKVLIAEDERSLRDVLTDLITAEERFELVAAASNADEAIELARATHPDVALVDVRMPGGGGPRVAREIRLHSPHTRLVALSAMDDRATVMEMLQAGAVGYLVKGTSADDIVQAVLRSARGQASLSPQITGEVINELVGQLELRDHESQIRRRRIDLMRRVVQGEGVAMAFQPIVDLRDGRMVGVEALARFGGRPARPPDRWFTEAADIGLKLDLELTAARAALAHLAQLPEDLYMTVNVSPDTAISTPFLHLVSQMPVERVVFELSEHLPVLDYDVLNEALGQLRARGGRLAIDDAGAGFASLQHILRLSPDVIKLDITLTKGVDSNQARRALAFALTSFASEIGADIIAEGVETEEEVEALRALGVTYGQGFHLGYPGPLPMVGPDGRAVPGPAPAPSEATRQAEELPGEQVLPLPLADAGAGAGTGAGELPEPQLPF
jgi:EAL domain-containing protein (putative c-di-GMP-specific phosphodiesterase class I)/CheY-like chemotaxis protein